MSEDKPTDNEGADIIPDSADEGEEWGISDLYTPPEDTSSDERPAQRRRLNVDNPASPVWMSGLQGFFVQTEANILENERMLEALEHARNLLPNLDPPMEEGDEFVIDWDDDWNEGTNARRHQ